MSQPSGFSIANKSNFSTVPRPLGNNLTYFLNANAGDSLWAMKSNGSVFPVSAGDMEAQISLSSAEILTLNTIPKEIIPSPGPGKAILVRDAIVDYTFVTAPYGANVSIQVITDTATVSQHALGMLNAVVNTTRRLADQASAAVAATQLLPDKKVVVSVINGNPVLGFGTATVKVIYRIITL